MAIQLPLKNYTKSLTSGDGLPSVPVVTRVNIWILIIAIVRIIFYVVIGLDVVRIIVEVIVVVEIIIIIVVVVVRVSIKLVVAIERVDESVICRCRGVHALRLLHGQEPTPGCLGNITETGLDSRLLCSAYVSEPAKQ